MASIVGCGVDGLLPGELSGLAGWRSFTASLERLIHSHLNPAGVAAGLGCWWANALRVSGMGMAISYSGVLLVFWSRDCVWMARVSRWAHCWCSERGGLCSIPVPSGGWSSAWVRCVWWAVPRWRACWLHGAVCGMLRPLASRRQWRRPGGCGLQPVLQCRAVHGGAGHAGDDGHQAHPWLGPRWPRWCVSGADVDHAREGACCWVNRSAAWRCWAARCW